MKMFKGLKKSIQNLGRLGPLLAFAIIAPGVGALVLVGTFDYWYESLRSLDTALPAFYLIFAISLAGFSLIPTHAASLIAGMLFGTLWGPLYALTAIVSASLLSYILVKIIMGAKALEIFSMNPKAHEVYNELLKHNGFRTFYIISLIRLSPVMPFAATNVLLSAGKVKFREFFLGSAIGLAPRVIIVAIAGAGLTKLDLSIGSHKSILIAGIAATALVIFIMGRISRQVLRKISQN